MLVLERNIHMEKVTTYYGVYLFWGDDYRDNSLTKRLFRFAMNTGRKQRDYHNGHKDHFRSKHRRKTHSQLFLVRLISHLLFKFDAGPLTVMQLAC